MGSSSPREDLSTEELFRRFAPFVARFLYRLGVGSEGLDDLVQEVFLVVHRRGGYKAGAAKPTSYLATIASNAASAYRRRRRTEKARSSDVEVEGLVSTNKGPVQVLEVSERLRLLQAALERLEPDLRSTLVLADIEGESCASIAASSGVPTGTVYWRLHEARKRFQRALRAEMAGVPARPGRFEDDGASASDRRERGPALAFAVGPFWLLSDARRLLRAGGIHAPVHYDVPLGLEKHRQLASTMGVPSQPPAIAPATVAAPASTGVGIVGVGSAGLAAIAAIAAALFLRSTPGASKDERASERSAAPASAGAISLTTRALASANQSASSELVHEGPPSPLAPSSSAAARQLGNATTSEPPAKAVESTASSGSSGMAMQSAPRAASSTAAPATKETHKGAASVATPADTSVARPADTSVAAPTGTQLEAREIARAERMLSSNPAGALAIVRGARARFTPSFLPEERDYIEVMALHALDRSGEAETAASRFLRAYPSGAFSNRVRRIVGR